MDPGQMVKMDAKRLFSYSGGKSIPKTMFLGIVITLKNSALSGAISFTLQLKSIPRDKHKHLQFV